MAPLARRGRGAGGEGNRAGVLKHHTAKSLPVERLPIAGDRCGYKVQLAEKHTA